MIGIVVHGGAASPQTFVDGCERSGQIGLALLEAGKSALEAAVAAVVCLENDGRFNAGSGSELRMDGVSVEMDAAVMDSRGRIGAVAAVYDVKNPVELALAVTETPHVFLVGDGAVALARRLGMPVLVHARSRPIGANPCDTVGVVVRDRLGQFAVASSTGGAPPMLLGRVGDTPLVGCGFYAGEYGAVAATGLGEEIIRHGLAGEVYRRLEAGETAQEACEWGVRKFESHVDVGLIALGRDGLGSASNRDMPVWDYRA